MDFENEATFKEFTTTIDTLDLEKEKDLPALTCVDLFPDPPHLISFPDDHQADGSLADDDEFAGFKSNENKTEDDSVEIINDDMSDLSHTFKEDALHREESNAEGSQKTQSPHSIHRDEAKASSSVRSSATSAPVSPASYFSSAESVVSTASSSKKIKKRFCRECNMHFRKTRELHDHLKAHIKLPLIRVERLSDDHEKVKEFLSCLSPKPSPTQGSLKLKLKLLDSQNFEVVPSKKDDKPREETDLSQIAKKPEEVKETTPLEFPTHTEEVSDKMSNTFLQPENRYFECPTFDGLESFAEEMMNTGEATEDLLKKLLETSKEPQSYHKEPDWSSNTNEFISIDSLAPRCNVCHMNFSHPKYLYEHKRMTGHDYQPRIPDPPIPTSQPDYGHQVQHPYMQHQPHPPPQNLPPLYQMAQMRGNFNSFGPRLNVRQMMQHHQQPSPPPVFHPSQCMMTRTPPPLYRMNGNPPNFPPNRYIEKRLDMYGPGPGPAPQYMNGNQHMNPEMMRQPIFLKSRLQKAIRGRSQGPATDIPLSPGVLTQQTAIRPRFLGPTPQMPCQMQFQRSRVQSPPKPGEPPNKKVKMESEHNQFSSPASSGIVSPGMCTSPGMPVIQSVHSGHSNAFSAMTEKPKESSADQANTGAKGVAKNPKDVANILATRGITVTHKGKTSFVPLENKGGNPTNASAQEAVQKLQANNSVSIISKKKPAEMNAPKLSAPSAETGHRVTPKFLSCPVITCKEKFLTTEGVNRHAFRWHGIPLPNVERSQKRMGRCRLCHHLCSSPEALQEHIRREHEPSVNEIGIPIVDLRNEEVKRKLAGLGIFNYVPLTAAGASTSSLAFPVVSVQGTTNSSICNLLGLGATSVLSLGPVKSIAVRKSSNENK